MSHHLVNHKCQRIANQRQLEMAMVHATLRTIPTGTMVYTDIAIWMEIVMLQQPQRQLSMLKVCSTNTHLNKSSSPTDIRAAIMEEKRKREKEKSQIRKFMGRRKWDMKLKTVAVYIVAVWLSLWITAIWLLFARLRPRSDSATKNIRIELKYESKQRSHTATAVR